MNIKIVFNDGRELLTHSITGRTARIQGADRDVLRIQFLPEAATISELQEIFKNSEMTAKFKIIETEIRPEQELNENGGTVEVPQEYTSEHEKLHYSIYISCGNVLEDKPTTPGALVKPEMEEFNVVEIAQLTHMELQIAQLMSRLT